MEPSLFLVGLLAVLSPGPDILLVFRTAALYGTASALRTTAGILTGNGLMIVLAFSGAAVAAALPLVQSLIAFAGGLYLLFLARKILLGRSEAVEADRRTNGGFARGLAVNLSNPKALLFFLVVLAPFADGPEPALAVVLLMSGVITGFLAAVAAGRSLGRLPAKAVRFLDLGAAGAFLFFGGGLLVYGIVQLKGISA